MKLSEKGNILYILLSNLNIVDILLVAEFRILIMTAIPQIIALLQVTESYVCETAANTLAKLSKQGNIKFSNLNIVDICFIAEFQELIGAAIPQIITLLRNTDVCVACANALAELSEQGKVLKKSGLNVVDVLVAVFQMSIRPAIPQIIAFLGHSEFYVCGAGADALSKLSEQGDISSFLT